MSLFSSLFRTKSSSSHHSGLVLDDGSVKFNGRSRYQPLALESILAIRYQPSDSLWQEVSIDIEGEGVLNYYFDCSAEDLKQAVEDICQALKPNQPICQFILSAKPGALSSRD
ncbi:MAG: hypothetical protein KUG78_09025 [Kangiellaceae bacterium]|nr:hypothetical protein [Kangiellaceae bacterium]